jgi:intracellular sulfur oxidation DsrE/DsrF family protein
MENDIPISISKYSVGGNRIGGVNMRNVISVLLTFCMATGVINVVFAKDSTTAPWGSAQLLDIKYNPQKVLYDVTTGNQAELSNILDRLSFLYKLYGSDPLDTSIVVVIHGDAIPFFAIKDFSNYKELMVRAQSLTVGTPIEFRMCKAAAKMMDYEPKDIHGFVKMVPMADAEIVRLQQEEGYAYMH